MREYLPHNGLSSGDKKLGLLFPLSSSDKNRVKFDNKYNSTIVDMYQCELVRFDDRNVLNNELTV